MSHSGASSQQQLSIEEQEALQLAIAMSVQDQGGRKVQDRRTGEWIPQHLAGGAASSAAASAAAGASAAHKMDTSDSDSDQEVDLTGEEGLSLHKQTSATSSSLTRSTSSATSSTTEVKTKRKLEEDKLLKEIYESVQNSQTISVDPLELAKMRGEDKALGLLIVYNDSKGFNKPFRVTVDKSSDALVAGVHSFLRNNERTLDSWIHQTKGKFQLAESTLLALHIILHLHAMQLTPNSHLADINISLLASSALQQSLQKEATGQGAVAAAHSISELSNWKELEFSKKSARAVIRFRHCDSLRQVTQGNAVALRVVYMDSLIWLQELGNFEEIQSKLTHALTAIANEKGVAAPVLLPKPQWEASVEDKPAVYAALEEKMLKTHWVRLKPEDVGVIRSAEVSATVKQSAAAAVTTENKTATVAATATATATAAAAGGKAKVAKHEDAPPSEPDPIDPILDHYNKHASAASKKILVQFCQALIGDFKEVGVYFLKGGFSDCGTCTTSVEFVLDSEKKMKSDMLPALVYKWVRDNGQTSFGLQQLVQGFQKKEYRFWFTSGSVPGSDVLSWRYACMLQSGVTSLEELADITVEQTCTLTPEANACYDLAHDLVKGDYISNFLHMDTPMPALRLDCGWNPKDKKAFLNEMAVSPGAWIFSECHKLDILCHVAKTLVGYIAPHLKAAAAANTDAQVNEVKVMETHNAADATGAAADAATAAATVVVEASATNATNAAAATNDKGDVKGDSSMETHSAVVEASAIDANDATTKTITVADASVGQSEDAVMKQT